MQALLTVTAIISTYNRSIYLADALQSILNQTIVPSQIIVIDDGSNDATKKVLAPFLTRIEYVYKDNGGKATALNLALSRVRGDAIWIFDDDDIAEPNALETLSGELMQDPDIDFVCAKHCEFSVDADGKQTSKTCDAPFNDTIQRTILHKCSVFQGGMLVRTKCYDAVGSFDETLIRAQDYDMLLRLARRFRGVELSDVLFRQRMHSGLRGSASSPVPRRNQYRIQRRYEQMIFRRLYAEYGLHEFGRSGCQTSEMGRADLLIERATVMGRKGLWDLAEEDIRRALIVATLLGTTEWSASTQTTLGAVFDDTSVGLSEFVYAKTFHRLLKETSISPLTRMMSGIFTTSLHARIRKAMLDRRFYHVVSLTTVLSCIVFARFSFVATLSSLLLSITDRQRTVLPQIELGIGAGSRVNAADRIGLGGQR